MSYSDIELPVSPDAVWYHVAFGHVPEHEQGYICSPVTEGTPLTPQHLASLAEPLKYLEPKSMAGFLLGLINLSVDSVSSRRGLAVLVSVRLHGVRDSKMREGPTFSHGAICLSRELSSTALDTSCSRVKEILIGRDVLPRPIDQWYQDYAQKFSVLQQNADAHRQFLYRYLALFDNLPVLKSLAPDTPSTVRGLRRARVDTLYIKYPVGTAFESLRSRACQIGTLLYNSDIHWRQVLIGSASLDPYRSKTTGLSVLFVPERERLPTGGQVLLLDQLAEEPEFLTAQLLGLPPPEPSVPPLSQPPVEEPVKQLDALSHSSPELINAAPTLSLPMMGTAAGLPARAALARAGQRKSNVTSPRSPEKTQSWWLSHGLAAAIGVLAAGLLSVLIGPGRGVT